MDLASLEAVIGASKAAHCNMKLLLEDMHRDGRAMKEALKATRNLAHWWNARAILPILITPLLVRVAGIP